MGVYCYVGERIMTGTIVVGRVLLEKNPESSVQGESRRREKMEKKNEKIRERQREERGKKSEKTRRRSSL